MAEQENTKESEAMGIMMEHIKKEFSAIPEEAEQVFDELDTLGANQNIYRKMDELIERIDALDESGLLDAQSHLYLLRDFLCADAGMIVQTLAEGPNLESYTESAHYLERISILRNHPQAAIALAMDYCQIGAMQETDFTDKFRNIVDDVEYAVVQAGLTDVRTALGYYMLAKYYRHPRINNIEKSYDNIQKAYSIVPDMVRRDMPYYKKGLLGGIKYNGPIY